MLKEHLNITYRFLLDSSSRKPYQCLPVVCATVAEFSASLQTVTLDHQAPGNSRELMNDNKVQPYYMKTVIEFFHCGEQLQSTLLKEIEEVKSVVRGVEWAPTFVYRNNAKVYENQTAYNKAFDEQFRKLGWEPQPRLRVEPKLIGDFRKNLVFVEIQFGNSSTLYRDYYKFQYGVSNGLLSLAVLIVPTKPSRFFPNRPKSVQNMAEYDLAHTCFEVLPINAPVLLVGLLPEN
jgi:hypothetical protein